MVRFNHLTASGCRWHNPSASSNPDAPRKHKDGSLRSITQGAPPANVNSCWMPIPARAPPTLMLRPLFPWLAPARCLGHADAQASVPFATSRAHRAPSLARTPPFQSTRFDGSTLRARDVGGKASSPLRGSKKTTPGAAAPGKWQEGGRLVVGDASPGVTAPTLALLCVTRQVSARFRPRTA